MNENIKTFTLRTVLSVTTGRLLTESEGPRDNGIGRMYELLNHMTGDSAFTYQLGRFAEECKPWLFRWFPELKIANAFLNEKGLDECISKTATPEEGIVMWLNMLKTLEPKIKDQYDIGQIPMDDHDKKDSLKKLEPGWKSIKAITPDELTEDEQKAMAKEQAEAEQEFVREQRILRIKQFLQTIIDYKSDDPNSKLFTTAEELLEFVVQYESKPSDVSNYEWNRFETILLTKCKALLNAESEAETKPKRCV